MGYTHTLLGGHIDGRPDYLPLAAKPRINSKLSLAAIEIEKGSEQHARIIAEGRFSLNMFSGRVLNCLGLADTLTEKKKCCDSRCTSFYGNHDDMPMLEAAPLALECTVYEVVDLDKSSVVMAEITGSWSKGVYFRGECSLAAVQTQVVALSAISGQDHAITAV
ncbi:flavin reductase [Desulfovibrio sp. JC010]|uniref:flavin reductase n=1 Tax=Desulfovibrio sp. JC010 TaxID=2593641 RepID=UPI0013D032B3|nr:flavin reductase [Desulfovibrio sp. JC010]NDV28595.1 hypothetical protein [Desulfovibrio sp. JC010]